MIGLFPPKPGTAFLLTLDNRRESESLVWSNHYTHSIPSGKSHWFGFDSAIVVFSIPANRFAASIVLGRKGIVWELTRLWAPDAHSPNLLSRAIAAAVREFSRIEDCDALVSYADPNAGHHGGIYQAASWVYQGQSKENRSYADATGQRFARRKFHSGDRNFSEAEIKAMGYTRLKLPGKHRYAKGLTNQARKDVAASAKPYLKPMHATAP